MRYLLAVAMLGLLPGCISVSKTIPPTAAACQIGKPMVETMLFLVEKPSNLMSRADFDQFIETEVTPRWKDDFTILSGQGKWLSPMKRNPTPVLVHFHDGSAAASADIEAIRNAYIKAFEQDAVLRTDRATCADF